MKNKSPPIFARLAPILFDEIENAGAIKSPDPIYAKAINKFIITA